ncbi:TetR/AcrR family transcriptional regulator [Pseudonocardia phyllosphaerae]|uniref:TetR/AcrR family transcriptional regulator n=1 Tax=Pseudonocardia phyllosphaerae TaxID=3390502 RepID=UPI00397909F6
MSAQRETGRRGRPPLSERDRVAQRLAISRHAVRLFRERGVAATSGTDVAVAAGISERTLWRLFRTKEALVEPLLTESLESFREILRSWPDGVDLADHLREAYQFLPEPSSGDAGTAAAGDSEAVLAIVRMTREAPGLRAVWLVLHERAEPTIAAVLAPRLGLPADAPEVRLQAATLNAAFRVATDDVAQATTTGSVAEVTGSHRRHLAEILRAATRIPAADT